MGTPEENPHGYKISSILYYVNNLKGYLMIIHGLIDGECSFSSFNWSYKCTYLSKKPYGLVLFPDEQHIPRKLDE